VAPDVEEAAPKGGAPPDGAAEDAGARLDVDAAVFPSPGYHGDFPAMLADEGDLGRQPHQGGGARLRNRCLQGHHLLRIAGGAGELQPLARVGEEWLQLPAGNLESAADGGRFAGDVHQDEGLFLFREPPEGCRLQCHPVSLPADGPAADDGLDGPAAHLEGDDGLIGVPVSEDLAGEGQGERSAVPPRRRQHGPHVSTS